VGSAQVTRYKLHEVEVVVDAQRPAVLRLADLYYPDWNVTVDGKPERLLRADHALRAVAVPAGHHTVLFKFESRAFKLGLWVSIVCAFLSLVLLGVGWWLARRTAPLASGPPLPGAAPGSTMSEADGGDAGQRWESDEPASRRPFDEERLRRALRQVVSGVAALHGAGKLHRDIKPSNVLVTPEGRVVMLDFGLVTELDATGAGGDRSLSLVGTPAYMSPEQGSRVPVSEKSDWYSVGVMLYEALTGRHPFTGTFVEMMSALRDAVLRRYPEN